MKSSAGAEDERSESRRCVAWVRFKGTIRMELSEEKRFLRGLVRLSRLDCLNRLGYLRRLVTGAVNAIGVERGPFSFGKDFFCLDSKTYHRWEIL